MALLIEQILDPNVELVDLISIVSEPAILTNFVKLAEEVPPKIVLAIDEDKKIVCGPALIPNVKIFRHGKSMGLDEDVYIFFKAETIREIAANYLKQEYNNNINLEHSDDTKDAYLMESWIIEDSKKDKSAALGFDLPAGTWMVSMKITSDKLWERIKSGEFNGFSIEGRFGNNIIGEIVQHMSMIDEREILPIELHKPVLDALSSFGETQASFEAKGYILIGEDEEITEEGMALSILLAIDSDPNEESKLDRGKYAIRYKYDGPRDDRNREFCARVLDLDYIYRKEDIDMMSFRSENKDFGTYSIFKYKGSYNCRHSWKRLIFVKTDGVPTKPMEDYRQVPEGQLPESYSPSDSQATRVNAAAIKMVKPSSGESERDFIGRCMRSLAGEFPDRKQRYAVAAAYWKSR